MQSVSVLSLDDMWQFDLGENDAIEFNFADVDFMSHDSLLYLVGLFQHRRQRNQSTTLVLPRNYRVIDYLRAWRFPEAIEEVAGLRFVDLIDAESRDSWDRLPPVSRYERVIDKPGGGRETILPKSFFALTPLRVPLRDAPEVMRTSAWRTAALERDRWLQSHVVSVLDYYLRRRGDEVATKIVYEAVLNAARHPAATLGYVSSQLIRSREKGKFGRPVAIEVCIWDNGKTYADTLIERLSAGRSIYSEAYGKQHEVFDLSIISGVGIVPDHQRLTSYDSTLPVTKGALTVAAFMLGVTSKPDRREELSPNDVAWVESHEDPAGTGLYYIRRTVLDKFSGTVSYLSGSMRLKLTSGAGPNEYHAEIHNSVEEYAPIAGNLLVANIPIQGEQSVPA